VFEVREPELTNVEAKLGTRTPEPPNPRTPNPRTLNFEPNLNTNRELRTEKRER